MYKYNLYLKHLHNEYLQGKIDVVSRKKNPIRGSQVNLFRAFFT